MPSKAISTGSIDLAKDVFKVFTIHYSAGRMAAHWNGIDVKTLQDYWAAKLHGIRPEALEYALTNLPTHPPTVDEFVVIANRCPKPNTHFLLLDNKPSQEDIERARRRVGMLAQQFGRRAQRATAGTTA